jgi:Fe2+ or Zn2+ uptake regulation protein
MKWENRVLEILRSEFRNKIFSTNDAFRVLNLKEGYSKGTVYRALHDLFKMGLVERLVMHRSFSLSSSRRGSC